jgi:hypothetical protein
MTRSGIVPVDHNASTTKAIQGADHWRNLVREGKSKIKTKKKIRYAVVGLGHLAQGGHIACVQERFKL